MANDSNLHKHGTAMILLIMVVTSPLHESRLLWIHDPHPNQPPRVTPRQTVITENRDSVPRNNQQTVPRNNKVVNHSDARARAPLDNIPSSSWFNSNLSHSSIPNLRSSVCNPVPRTNLQRNKETIQVREQAVSSSLPPKRKRDRKHRRERRAREREERSETIIHDARWASQRPGDPSSSSVPAQVTQSGLQDSDPISAMRPAVYHPPESVGNSLTNDNSPFQIDLESGEFPGLYKPADPDPQHDNWAFSPAAYSSDKGPPSPTRTPAAHSSDSRTRTGIVYPLQPRSRRPDVCIQVEASLPEPAALLRPDLRQPSREAPTSLPRTHKRLSRKR